MRKQVTTQEIINRLKEKDWTILGKAISVVENYEEGRQEILDYAWQAAAGDPLIIGLTGAGGAGKSTLSDKLVKAFRADGLQVGVLPIDPSSPYTGGAVLGDRIRMSAHSRDTGVFIHSFGSRGLPGGLSRAAKDVLYLYKAFAFDVIIMESVGAGQGETDITDFVDVTTLVLAPGNGDSIQMIKAGTQETADLFVVNKADRPEAETLVQQLTAATMTIPEDRRPQIIKTCASRGEGVDELISAIRSTKQRLLPFCEIKKQSRLSNEIYSGAFRYFEEELKNNVRTLLPEVLAGKLTPFEAADKAGKSVMIRKL